MKKKQILFLFAASALFAACSSDEMPGNTEGGDDNTITVADDIPSSVAVSTEEGFGMTVGASSAITKSVETGSGSSDYFVLELPSDILGDWDGFVAKADDFYIIRTENSNKTVIKTVNDGSNSAEKYNVKVTRDNLTVTVDNINRTDEGETGLPVEYTFEVYIWITNQIEKTYSGADGVYDITVENFSYTDKLEWIGLSEGTTVTKDTERGVDFTQDIADADGATLYKNVTAAYGDNKGQYYHYNIRYNVYRGLQGNPTLEDGVTVSEESGLGNTPYIKVSIHTCRIENPADPDGEEVFPVLPKD